MRTKPHKNNLPLIRLESFKTKKDFVPLWEQLSSLGPAILLESAGDEREEGRWIILAGKPEEIYYEAEGRGWLDTPEGRKPAPFEFWEFLDEISGFETAGNDALGPKDLKLTPPRELRAGGFVPFPYCLSKAWFGVLSYDFGHEFTVKKPKGNITGGRLVPDYYFFKPGFVAVFDRLSSESYYFGEEIPEKAGGAEEAFEIQSLRALSNLEGYKGMVEKVKKYIGQGDIYQANIAQIFQARWKGQPSNLYRLLREMNPGPFMGLFRGGHFTVVSSSPERLAVGRGDWLETRPIAGTRPRSLDPVKDLQNLWELKTNPKEQAEHLMLVDLARNDLGRVSQYGTVQVKNFGEIKSYAKVHHLVSVVQGLKSKEVPFSRVLQSLFPGGTITGCPKIRSMEIIREVESRPRGFYTGSMGYVAPASCFDFNILIRSLTLWDDGTLEFLAGAGIVADSDPQKEYMETLYKVEALAQALGTSLVSNP